MEHFQMGIDIVDLVGSTGGVISKLIPKHRTCNILIANDSKYTLCNPRMYIRRGCCSMPLPPTISPSESGDVLFTKTPIAACGAVGIFTYELLDNSTQQATEQIAVMFKVPFNLHLKSNMYAVGVFDISKTCVRELYQEMSKKLDSSFVRGKAKGDGLTHKHHNVTIMATMSDCYTPVIKVQVRNE